MIVSDKTQTKSSIIAYNSDGDMTKNDIVTITTKPGITKFGIEEKTVQNYLYVRDIIIIKYLFEKIQEIHLKDLNKKKDFYLKIFFTIKKPVIKWCVEKIPADEIAGGRFYADSELNSTYSDQQINFVNK